MHRNTLTSGAIGLAAFALSSTALAGGLERHGYDVDLLFEKSPYVFDGTVTYVMPNRELKNAVDHSVPAGNPTNLNNIGTYSTSADGAQNYVDPYVGAKAAIGDSIDCMIDYSEPWGANANPGRFWTGAKDMTEIEVFSRNYGGTCSYKFDAGPGQFRVIGGGFYQEIGGHKEAIVFAPEILPALGAELGGLDFSGFSGLGRLEGMEDRSGGWRLGIGYEIPEYAMRASLVYNSRVKYDSIGGTLNLTGVPAATALLETNLLKRAVYERVFGQKTPVIGSATLPDSLELKLQSGVAPDWLAFGSVKWTNWSLLQSVAFTCDGSAAFCGNATGVPLTALDLFYRDGWTVTGGVGHKFNEQWSGGASLTWDRGTSTVTGSNSDSWTVGLGTAYTPTENVELRFAGALGILTGGESNPTNMTTASYEYGTDLVSALSAELKVKF
ncbi:long-chain fatty acid transport protein [Mycoplana sp. BE70]|uniref:OmpP1/FadL family transporter n=1 Tax=Mycoplana sp. BE70 TaxID=2817775 RepID=UPI00286513DE|nr:OmpP1/FadL family transporter [Mycoplana sp. BE70]MDR6758602.1 long-chain fatty acid transport protein [Mycoplana sp. BE70]